MRRVFAGSRFILFNSTVIRTVILLRRVWWERRLIGNVPGTREIQLNFTARRFNAKVYGCLPILSCLEKLKTGLAGTRACVWVQPAAKKYVTINQRRERLRAFQLFHTKLCRFIRIELVRYFGHPWWGYVGQEDNALPQYSIFSPKKK